MVQQELYPSDEGRQEHGDPGEPRPDEAAPGVPEALIAQSASEETAPAPYEALPPAEGSPGISDPAPLTVAAPALTPFDQHGAAQAAFEHPGMAAAGGGSTTLHRLGVWRDELVAWFKTLASAAVYATLIVTFGFQVARVEGQSMAPTLADQDRLIVNKLAYRIGEPRRGDIVMLYYPLDPDKSFVKRVIAEEGDEVRIVDGRVYVNDVPLADDFVPPEYRDHDTREPERVKDGFYYVMGDHRNNSSDSRHWGQVPKKYIIGKVQLRWWPIPNARVF